MEWWDEIGNFAAFFPDTPALAVDFALRGANPDYVGYALAYGMQKTPTEIDVYPPEEMSFAPVEA